MKAYFLTRQVREKLLIIGLIGVGLAFWVAHLWDANKNYRADDTATAKSRQEQEDVLSRRAEIESAQAAVIAKLDPGQSIRDTTALEEAILNMAGEGNGKKTNTFTLNTTAKPIVVRGTQLTMITQHISFTNLEPDLSTLLPFYQALEKNSPYISIYKSDFAFIAGRPARGQRGAGGVNGPNPGGNFGGGPGGAGGFGGGRRGGAITNTVGALDLPTGATGTSPATAVRAQQTGPRLTANFDLIAISINGISPARAPSAPRSAAAPPPNGS